MAVSGRRRVVRIPTGTLSGWEIEVDAVAFRDGGAECRECRRWGGRVTIDNG